MACPECGSSNLTQIDNKSEQLYTFERYSCDKCGCIWTWECSQDIEEHGDKEE